MKIIYIIRHCEAEGQEPNALLTSRGINQARKLALSLKNIGIVRIVSSPFKRAIESVKPLATIINVPLEIDSRFREREIGEFDGIVDINNFIKESFHNPRLKLRTGESHLEARRRGVEAIKEILKIRILPAAITSHGNMIAILLNHFDNRDGYRCFKYLAYPDVYKIIIYDNNSSQVKRLKI